jgi:hypothetical protein
VAIEGALVNEESSCLVFLESHVDSRWFQSKDLANFQVRQMLIEAEIQNLLHVQRLELYVYSSALSFFFNEPFLRRRLLALKLPM